MKFRKTEHIKCVARVVHIKNMMGDLGEKVLLSFPVWRNIRVEAQRLFDQGCRPSLFQTQITPYERPDVTMTNEFENAYSDEFDYLKMWKTENHTEDFRKLEWAIEFLKEKLEEQRVK